MKREIKRLQRLRDLFRQNVNNPAVSEQHKLVEARKRIENVSYRPGAPPIFIKHGSVKLC